jgi:hypothetical protein
MRREVNGMAFLWWTLAVVAFVALSWLFSTDSRPGADEPPRAWFGRR